MGDRMEVRMLVVQGKPRGKSLVLPRGKLVIGRGPECFIRSTSDSVSRQHCLLKVSEGEVLVRDLGSTNGTLVNGNRLLNEKPLRDGDLLQLGPLVLKLCVGKGDAPAPSISSARKETK